MDIYNYLKKDHRKVSALFEEIISAEDDLERQRLFLLVRQELELHADPEHQTFYEALSKSSKGKKDAEHGDKEHVEIKDALAKLAKISLAETAKWYTQFGELKHIVEHHVEDEESTMFEDAKKVISDKKAQELPEEMELLKDKMRQSKKFIEKYKELETA